MSETKQRRSKRTNQVHYIYKIHFLKGFPCGRYYIGKRTYYGTDINRDSYTGSGIFCKHYFKKYGAIAGETYIKEIIEINPSKKINHDREIFWIGDLWKTDPLCMNLIKGGNCGKEDFSEDTREKISKSKLGNKCGIGHKVPKELVDQLVERNSKAVAQYSLTGEFIKEFSSAANASRETGICRTKITCCCNGTRNTSGGYIWKFKGDSITADDLNITPTNYKSVIQMDLEGQYIAEYPTLAEAAKAVNGKRQGIQKVLNGKQKKAYGYKWIEKVK